MLKNIGFTLLEVLVVIGIIAIILGLGTASYSTAQKKARDAKRKIDLRNVQKGLEQYYVICNYKYPTPATGLTNAIICLNPSIVILNATEMPIDPKTKNKYNMTGDGDSYSICAPTISAGSGLDPGMGLETEKNPPYCLKNQQ